MQDFSARFEELRHHYSAQLAEKAAQMLDAWQRIEAGTTTPAAFDELQRIAHNLAGTGSTFGFPEVSNTANALDAVLSQLRQEGHDESLMAEVRYLLHTLHQSALGGNAPEPIELPTSPTFSASTHIYFLFDSGEEAESLASQITNFGYEAHIFTDIDALSLRMHTSPPDVLVADMSFLERPERRVAVDRMRRVAHGQVPLVIISWRNDFAARLHAVRVGGNAYLVRPVDTDTLIEHLDEITERQRTEPYRVLIVDDSRILAETYATFLNAAGMQATIITDATVALSVIMDLQPDLILMDMYMPACEGRELAAVIRQQPALNSIPIVFLSAEMDRRTQLNALEEGGDDFLTKPINPDHLIAAVTIRIRRARVIRSQMLRDSLTGLFNHSVTEDLLVREVARAQRKKRQLSIVMLDIDHLKEINETYGHAAGDRVLKSLARMLQQRLRISDLIGRFGGDEFVVIMPDTDGAVALRVIDSIRERFVMVQHRAGVAEFNVTFSGGVATLQASGDVTTLNESADIALYQAKHHGRNQLVLATHTLFRESPIQGEILDAPAIEPITLLGVQARILVVDDDEHVRLLLQHWLGAVGYDVHLCALGEEALIMEPVVKPDLILLDVLMPDLDGLEVLDTLRSRGCDASIVLTTAFGSERIAVTAMRRGADDYLRKPIVVDELQTMLERNLERLRLRRQNSALQQQLEEQRKQLEVELARAARVQADLLPRQMPRLPGFTLAARCIPARQVGGDFYDWHSPGPGLLNLTFGDVMGKGMPAALLMTTVRAVMRSVGRQTPPLVNLRYALTALDADLNHARAFVTMFHAQLDLVSRRLSFIDAGHGLCFIRRAGGRVEPLGPRGVPLGVPSREPYAQGEVQFFPGDALILFSDGLLDTWPALADNHLILADLLSDDIEAQAMVERILALPALVGSVIDDLTVVVLACSSETQI
nr:response regulator [Oscillochloris trichoides]